MSASGATHIKRPKYFYRESKTARKKLTVPEEELFTLLLLRFGPPNKEWPTYINPFKHHVYASGINAWCRETEVGRAWAACVRQHGVTVARLSRFYYAWERWCEWMKRHEEL